MQEKEKIGEMKNSEKIILHLCASKFGSDSLDYVDAGYDVRLITKDIGVENYHPPENVYGIIANPPCTMFSIARTRAKTPRDLEEGMRLVKECLRIIWEAQYKLKGNTYKTDLKFWMLENPETGMLKYFLGKPAFKYQPYEFGEDRSKRTALWGNFNEPKKLKEYKKSNNVIGKVGREPTNHNSDIRSIASPFFTKAFFEANQ